MLVAVRLRPFALPLLLLGAAAAGCGVTSRRGATESAAGTAGEARDGAAEGGPGSGPSAGACMTIELPAEWGVEGLDDLWVSGPDDVLAVADGQVIVHYDGARWTRAYEVGDMVHLINDLHAPPSGPLVAVGQSGLLLLQKGAAWRRADMPTRGNLFAVWASAPGRALVVTNGGQAYRLEGDRAALLADTSTRRALFAIWGAAADDVHAVGEGGTILHFDGSSWTERPSPTTELLTALWGHGPREVFAVGTAGAALRFDGASWTSLPTGAEEFVLVDLWGFGPADVWAVGRTPGPPIEVLHLDDLERSPGGGGGAGDPEKEVLGEPFAEPRGVLLHYDGTSWSRAQPEVDLVPMSVFGTGDHDLYLAGLGGSLLRCDTRRFTH